MSDNVCYGRWTNWSKGSANGSTITLSPSSAGFLVAFLAIFVSVAGGSLWRILAFTIHQHQSSRAPRDGLHYQQQAILRNAATPGAASWQFFWLIPLWTKVARRPFLRLLPLIAIAFFNLAVFFAVGILVAEVTRTIGSEVLIRSSNCGNWTLNTTEQVLGFQTKTLNDTVTAASYARDCYGDRSSALECNQYAAQALPYTSSEQNPNTTCPFREDMCLIHWPVYMMDTGNVSSHYHLGINAKPQDRIIYRRKATCAPIKTRGFITSFSYTDAVNASLGAVPGAEGDPRNNFTIAYNRRAATVGYGYDLNSVDWSSGDNDNIWEPDSAVHRDDADVSLMFLAANSIQYYGKVEDPIFQATTESSYIVDAGKNVTFYESDYYVNPLGCVDQHQSCNPVSHRCTKLDSYYAAVVAAQKDLQLNQFQYVTVSVISLDLYLSTISQSIGGRGSAALEAQQHQDGLISGPLPNTQWQKEVQYWFSTGLTKLQKHIFEYAAGPTNVIDYTYVSRPSDAPSHQLCENLVVGTMIPGRGYKLSRWALDEKLQLQRLAFEGAGRGSWRAGSSAVPVTTEQTTFAIDIWGDRQHPTFYEFSNEEKNTGTFAAHSTLSDTATTPHTIEPRMDDGRSDSLAPTLPEPEFEDHWLSGPFNNSHPT
ncbi:hypothetical protein EJ04DRAFT_595491 [Polyplosphaeria fusca]|uniref:Uncharacterized protein n=1 Tax=Polyplosphaeria fusca TaxID=682080 RepID=A0A9P4UVW5_9PLEO|nr:hypothetical protein EJ04DRAFT_595491 [Polyplosphaeria fusca]